MKKNKKYWKGLEQLKNTVEFQKYTNKEFSKHLPLSNDDNEPSRRDFLKVMGFGLTAVSLAACEAPIRKAIPFVKKPDNLDPSLPNFYASTYDMGGDFAPIVVKTREGRPIKIEGNNKSSLTMGGTSPQAQASVLTLYDKQRLKQPLLEGKPSDWATIDQNIIQNLNATPSVYLVSTTIASPSTLKSIEILKQKFSNVKHISYDSHSFSGTLSANQKTFGKYALPSYDFSKAQTIVSFTADFLGNWPDRIRNNNQFAKTRKLDKEKNTMSRLYSFESNLTLTGSNADYRFQMKPSQEGLYIANLYNLIASKSGATTYNNVSKVANAEILQKVANELWDNQGKSLVVSGSNDIDIQIIVNAINSLLGNYGNTIDINNHQNIKKGNDESFQTFLKELETGNTGVIFYNCNPVYDHREGGKLAQILQKVTFSVSTSDRLDETSSKVKIVAPDHHFLESWNDYELVKNKFSLSQPTISNIFDTRQVQESFLIWSGNNTKYYDFLMTNWKNDIIKLATNNPVPELFWKQSLHDGIFEASSDSVSIPFNSSFNEESIINLSSRYLDNNEGLEIAFYFSNSIGTGTQANNPWLQEMPDPITKACWDNYITVSPKQAEQWGVVLGDMETQLAKIKIYGNEITVPIMPQPGQAYNTIGLALGYGRTNAGKVADNLGVNAYPLLINVNNNVSYSIFSDISIEVKLDRYRIAQTQTHHTYMGRETVIQESTLNEYQKDPQAGRSFPKVATSEGFKKPSAISLWKGHEYANHHWGLVVDLNSCTGCASCTVACQAENNIPVVGKQEVLNRRDMHWIRIDRYYSSDAEEGDLSAMEIAAENPEVTFQPMMCQHCNNAPCETVCPVAATTHSTEGLNQMTYNRCIGTRYCANNCPYKVRRFNWFKYHGNDQFPENLSMNNDLGRMVLNPDVTVRARGVIEKCSMCVQRIQAGKLQAKIEKRRPIDGEITTACASSCPTEALVFGDMKDENSKISKLLNLQQNDKGVEAQEPRAYHVLEEIRVMPNVWYLTKIRNKVEAEKQS